MQEKIFDIPEYNGAGIYAIVNKDDKRVYVGQSSNIRNRAIQHHNALINGNHQNQFLNFDRKKRFKFVILDKLYSTTILTVFEKIYMISFEECGWQLYNIQPKKTVNCPSLFYSIGADMYNEYKDISISEIKKV